MIKKTFVLFFALIIFLAGCSYKQPLAETTAEPTITQNTQPTLPESTETIYQQHMAAISVPAVTENLEAEDGTLLFQYTYQNMSLVLQDPDVAQKIIIDFLGRVDNTRKLADETAKLAQTSYDSSQNWIPYLYHVTYSPTRIDHSVLSLFGANALYSGAFHPDRTCISANYDLITGDVLTLASIMSATATADDFCELVLDGLTEMVEGNYLYENYADTVKQRFMTDTSQDEAWYFSQTGLCFFFAPYEIAPYSSGVISVELPYELLSGLLNDAYFPAERNSIAGTINTIPFENADLTQFSQIAEVIENPNGKMYLAYTDTAIQDVRIIISDVASSYTIFAAYGLTPGDAVMVQTSDETAKRMILSYKSSNDTITNSFIR